METNEPRLLLRTDVEKEFEQYVMAEVLTPDVPNVYGDIYTRAAIWQFALEYARQGYGIDVNHDRIDVRDKKAFVVESFVARKGDPDFIEGSWVIGMQITDDELWARILAGEINGYSYEAICYLEPIIFTNLRDRQIVGTTEPDPFDGHTHDYALLLDEFNRPIAGGTSSTNGHYHTIASHTVTEESIGLTGVKHRHRFQVIIADTGEGETE